MATATGFLLMGFIGFFVKLMCASLPVVPSRLLEYNLSLRQRGRELSSSRADTCNSPDSSPSTMSLSAPCKDRQQG
eukprot:1836977-Rhodomonas_salina.1